MSCCCQAEAIAELFGPRIARRELRRFRRRGPIRTTRMLIEALRAEGVGGASILDVGGGVGAIHHELLDAGASEALQVDVSPSYLEAAREEAARRGHDGRVELRHGDFVALAGKVGDFDVVSLDRVICCYPDMERLVALSAGRARRLYGAVYPRDVWWVRAALAMGNACMRLRRSAFRLYLHPPAAVEAVLREHGLTPRTRRRTLVWHIVVYAREGGRA